MNTTVIVDEAGRIAIPQRLQEELHLTAGDVLTLETEGERIILPARPSDGGHASGARSLGVSDWPAAGCQRG